jgi:phosphoribosylamine--glycine ligase
VKVLVVGADGRAHALAWAIARSSAVRAVRVAPGNGGTGQEPKVTNVAVRDTDLDALAALARSEAVDLVVVSPEAPLAAGLVDHLRGFGLSVFGPTQAAARIESSKAWARDFMARHGVPHPRFTVVASVEEALHAIEALGGACVVKADGLAAGKGVVVCDTADEARRAVQAMLVEGVLGAAAEQVVVEERLAGPELSVMAVTDGRRFCLLPAAQDHKRLLAGDQGPNTGGMGAYAPAPIGTDALLDEISARVIGPTLAGLAEEGSPFTGCLYAGLMLTGRGPVVIEFNARFGDPETQVQLPLLTDDLAALLAASAAGDLGERPERLASQGAACTVALAAAGYPTRSETGRTVHGLAAVAGRPGLKVFHAGTRREGEAVVTTGGRALHVVGLADSLPEAVARAYGAIGAGGVGFEGMQWRADIAARALPAVPG